MIQAYSGELAALLVAVFWTITALAFETATRKIGSMAVNMIRLLFAFVFLSLFSLFFRHMFLPFDATAKAWLWLSLSGLVGFVFGDYFLFASYRLISSRISMLIMTLVPIVTAFLGWLILDELMTVQHMIGMILIVFGISLAIFNRSESKKIEFKYPVKGLLFAFFGVLGQSGGLILSKIGMGDYSPFASTQIRIIAAVIGFGLLILVTGRAKVVFGAFRQRNAMFAVTTGSIFGPFLGVSFSLIAIQRTTTGIASTLMAIVPILILPPAAIIYRQKIGWYDIIGASISVGGVVLFFL